MSNLKMSDQQGDLVQKGIRRRGVRSVVNPDKLEDSEHSLLVSETDGDKMFSIYDDPLSPLYKKKPVHYSSLDGNEQVARVLVADASTSQRALYSNATVVSSDMDVDALKPEKRVQMASFPHEKVQEKKSNGALLREESKLVSRSVANVVSGIVQPELKVKGRPSIRVVHAPVVGPLIVPGTQKSKMLTERGPKLNTVHEEHSEIKKGSPVSLSTQGNTQRIEKMPTHNKNEASALSFKNALLGLALAYLGNVRLVTEPILFMGKNIKTLSIGFLHLFIPLSMLWFASHWTPQIEARFWGAGLVGNSINLGALFLVCGFVWSITFMGAKGILRGLRSMASQFDKKGAQYLEEN